MKLEIDISVVAGARAMGRLFGSINLASVPTVGSRIDLSGSGRDFPPGVRFSPQFEVEHVTYFPVTGGVERSMLLSLSDLTLDSPEDVSSLTQYLRKEYELDFEEFY
jgi:hypothetical protein